MRHVEPEQIMRMPIKREIRKRFGHKTGAILHLMLIEQKNAKKNGTYVFYENQSWFRMHQGNLKRSLGVVEATIYEKIKELTNDGIIRTCRCPDDNRRKFFWVFEDRV